MKQFRRHKKYLWMILALICAAVLSSCVYDHPNVSETTGDTTDEGTATETTEDGSDVTEASETKAYSTVYIETTCNTEPSETSYDGKLCHVTVQFTDAVTGAEYRADEGVGCFRSSDTVMASAAYTDCISSDLPAGEYLFQYYAEGYKTVRSSIVVFDGGTMHLKYTLYPEDDGAGCFKSGAAVELKGDIYAAKQTGVVRFTPEGEDVCLSGSFLPGSALCTDGDELFAVDTLNHVLRVDLSEGESVTVAMLPTPASLLAAERHRLWFRDTNGIYSYHLDTTELTYYPTVENVFSVDGTVWLVEKSNEQQEKTAVALDMQGNPVGVGISASFIAPYDNSVWEASAPENRVYYSACTAGKAELFEVVCEQGSIVDASILVSCDVPENATFGSFTLRGFVAVLKLFSKDTPIYRLYDSRTGEQILTDCTQEMTEQIAKMSGYRVLGEDVFWSGSAFYRYTPESDRQSESLAPVFTLPDNIAVKWFRIKGDAMFYVTEDGQTWQINGISFTEENQIGLS